MKIEFLKSHQDFPGVNELIVEVPVTHVVHGINFFGSNDWIKCGHRILINHAVLQV